MILALDLGTKLGIYTEGTTHADTINLGKGDVRFYRFYDAITDCLLIDRPSLILYEGAAHQQGMAMPLWHGLVGVLKMICEANKIPLQAIHAMTMKKVFTGKGRWTAEECMQIAEKYKFKERGIKGGKAVFSKKSPIMAKCDDLGIGFDDDNGADAYGVYWAHKVLSLENII